MENVTQPGQIVFLGVLFLLFCAVAWWWLRSGVPKDVEPDDASAGELIERGFSALLYWRPTSITLSDEQQDTPQTVAVAPVVTTVTTAEQPIVMPNNEYSSGLSDSGRAAFETKAQTLAQLYEAGVVTNLSKAICKAYGCTVQSASKSDSTYQMALKAVNRYLPKKDAGAQFRMTPEQEAAREALGLNSAS